MQVLLSKAYAFKPALPLNPASASLNLAVKILTAISLLLLTQQQQNGNAGFSMQDFEPLRATPAVMTGVAS
jgi:hypothetical protein